MFGQVDSAVAEIASNPDVGEKKKGDLSELWVHKFRFPGQLYLVGYTRNVRFDWYGWRLLVFTKIFTETSKAKLLRRLTCHARVDGTNPFAGSIF